MLCRMITNKNISNITVIGAGTMGHGIAEVAALGGFTTVLNDVSQDFLEAAGQRIRHELFKAFEVGKLTQAEMDAAMARLKFVTKMEPAAKTADLIIRGRFRKN